MVELSPKLEAYTLKPFSSLELEKSANESKLISLIKLDGYEFSLSPLPPKIRTIGFTTQNDSYPLDISTYRKFFTIKEYSQLKEFKQAQRQLQWLIGRLLGKLVIQQLIYTFTQTKVPLQDIVIYQDQGSKPNCHILSSINVPDIHFSISHKKFFFITVASSFRVGIDVESIRPFSNSFIQKIFTIQDLNTMDSLFQSFQREYSQNFLLTLFWSCKEAVAKALGMGLKIDFQDLHVEYHSGQFFVKTPEKNRFLVHVAQFKDYIITLAH